MDYVAYYRVSTQEQGRSGLGLDAQRDVVRRHVAAKGARLVAEFTEIESGRHDERPQLRKARVLAVRSKATLLIAKLDRLARSVSFISALMKDRRLEIEACDLPAANAMTLHIMAAVAEGEATAISTRTKAALAQAKARGVRLGFSHENKLSHAHECGAIGAACRRLKADRYAALHGRMIEDLRARGMTFAQIADDFTRMRVPLARQTDQNDGMLWRADRIYQIYKRYKFIGPPDYRLVLEAKGAGALLNLLENEGETHGRY